MQTLTSQTVRASLVPSAYALIRQGGSSLLCHCLTSMPQLSVRITGVDPGVYLGGLHSLRHATQIGVTHFIVILTLLQKTRTWCYSLT